MIKKILLISLFVLMTLSIRVEEEDQTHLGENENDQ